MKKNKDFIKKVSQFRVKRLLELAKVSFEKNNEEDEELAKKYVKLARQINKHYKANALNKKENILCKKCNVLLIPGITAKIRVSNKSVIYICKKGHQNKIIIKSRKT